MKWIPFVTGLGATFAALVVLAAQPPSPTDGGAAAVSGAGAAPSAFIVETPIVATPAGTPSVLPGLPDEVGELLGDTGYATFATEADIGRSLTPEVVQTLVANGAVLVLPQEPNTFGGK